MTYDHKLHVAQEQHDSREPRDGSTEPCENCERPWEDHYIEKVGVFCDEDHQVEFEPLDVQGRRDDYRLDRAGL